jgi:hypothetical protein
LKAADIAVDGGKLEDSASVLAQARLLFERGGAGATEQGLADQVQARLQLAKEALSRGLEALTAGIIDLRKVMHNIYSIEIIARDERCLASLTLVFVGKGETHILNHETNKAGVEAARAREELTRAGVRDEFAERLAALEAAISTTSQALQLRQKALEEMEAASTSVEQAQARRSLPPLRIDCVCDNW